MKRLALALALLAPTTAMATQTPVAEIEAIAQAEQSMQLTLISSAPQLPLTDPATATACAFPVDPLPQLLTLASMGGQPVQIAFCLQY